MSKSMMIEKAEVDREALRGKVAVVTGAGRGIGRETALLMARLSAAVAIAEINDTGAETEEAIRAAGGQALFVRTDVSTPASVANLRRQVLETFGDVDVLVNNATVYTTTPILDLSVEEWDRVFAVNLRGAFLCIKAFLPAMLRRREGVIVLMESAEGMPCLAPYLASKVGLRSLAMSLAQEVGEESGVSVYCFGPGLVDTPGQAQAFRDLAPRYGMSVEEFVRNTGGHLISAELCATGLVGTILHAKEVHGQETGYVVGLSKLGLDPSGERWPTDVPGAGARVPAQARASDEMLALCREATALNRKMEEILRANIKEYEDLTMFQRPIMKRMFQQGTGLKVEDWLANAEEMTRQLASAAGQGQGPEAAIGPARLTTYIAQLERMAAFITKQESDARGWIRDPKMLEVALQALQDRKQTVQNLASVLSELQACQDP